MSDELLSQDQIDALAEGSDLPAGEAAGNSAGEVDYDNLKSAFDVFSEQSSTVLSTVLSKEVKISIEDCEAADPEKINSDFAQDHLVLKVNFEKDLSGPMHFIISKKDTAIMADLMMMGDGAAEYEEDHKDAIAELLNQIMGATSTAFGMQYSLECSVGTAEVNDFDPAATEIPVADCSQIRCAFQIADVADSAFMVLVPNDLSAALAAKASATASSVSETDDSFSSEAQPVPQDFGTPFAPEAGMSAAPAAATPGNINMLLDVQLQVAIELGRTEMSIKRILELGPGSIIELDRMAGEPIDLLVNGKVVAKGEVVVVDENFGIRIVSLVSPEERLKSLK